MTTRPRHLRFMGGATVFPGGALDASDLDARWETASALSRTAAAARLGVDDAATALGLHVCALREAFEEVGLLCGRGRVRQVPRRGTGSFLDRCLVAGVVLATDRLVPAGRWVTPHGAAVRFDAWFFACRAPDGWTLDPDPQEVERCAWLTPSAALDELAAGRALMAPPTIAMLTRLAGAGDAAAALARLRRPHRGREEPSATRLSPRVQVVLAPNPGIMTGPGTNTYVVGAAPACVIDPAVDDGSFVAAVEAAAGVVGVIAVTHRHDDHTGGVAALAARSGAPVRAFGRDPIAGVAVSPVADGDVLTAGGATLRAIHAPGHAPDHLCLLLEEEGALFAGDNVLGEGTAVIAPPEGDMRAYLDTLRRLRALGAARIYPGHFRPLEPAADAIDAYLAHRAGRARSILDVLGAGPAALDDIAAAVYATVPDALQPLARVQALAMLEMLAQDGRVTRAGDLWIAGVEGDTGGGAPGREP